MERCEVKINTAKSYPVIIKRGAIEQCGELIAERLSARRAALISDDTVAALYGDAARASLEASGFEVLPLSFPAGEGSKTPETLFALINQLGSAQLTRDDLVIALGGGVTGDIAGFASAVYKRGVPLVQLPTTLLAICDSSVGGKTAVNMPCGKNSVGAFKQPELVICDPAVLDTLCDAEFSCAMAEIIKCAMLRGDELPAAAFPAGGRAALSDTSLTELIYRCVSIKARIVEADELDRGERRLLNLGHSFGHAIESASAYAVSHGQAVGLGMLIITNAAELLGECTPGTARQLSGLISDFDLPVKTTLSAQQLIPYLYADKKRSGGDICLVIPKSFGCCELKTVSLPEAERYLRLGLEAIR